MSHEIRIYVADLAAYNAGYLHGVWIDATQNIDDIQDQITAMLAESPVDDAEEYAIHDYEGFDGYHLSEYAGIHSAHDIACFIADYPDFGGALLANLHDLDEARCMAEEHYVGCHASLADYAQELTEQTTTMPQHLAYYIDYQSMARDMELGGDVFTLETAPGTVHVFLRSVHDCRI
ncbi:antirestriction protein ArdA [Pseudomonas aeruginosa]